MKYLDDLSQLGSPETIYIYGSGSHAKTLSDQISYHRKDIKILNYLDKFKKSGFINSIEILNLEKLSQIDKSKKIIVSTDISFWEEIAKDLNRYNLYFNRFNDFNIYRRKEEIYDKKYIKSLFVESEKIDTMFSCIENQNIKTLIENKQIIDSPEIFFEKINLNDSFTVLNGGGSNGNENEKFLEKIGENGKIYSFDPYHQMAPKIQQIEVYPYVLYGSTGKVNFVYDGSRSKIVDDYKDSSELINSITIDNFIKKKDIKNLDFITLDVEGAEKQVLQGAKNCIEKFMPNLAISIYHSTADFFEIPLLINELCSDYKLDIGIYSQQGVDTILHAHIDSK